MVFDFPIKNASLFISSDNYVLNRLNDVLSFEIVFGHNGKMWINSDDGKNILKLYKVLEKSLDMEKEEIEKLINETFNS
jgi:exosome complex RNA-binding protein Rrp4